MSIGYFTSGISDEGELPGKTPSLPEEGALEMEMGGVEGVYLRDDVREDVREDLREMKGDRALELCKMCI